MFQRPEKASHEGDGSWLPLIEYSVRTGISLSTLRRKIKSNSIQFRLQNGRYLILFSELNNAEARRDAAAQAVRSEAPSVPSNPAQRSAAQELAQLERQLQEKETYIQFLQAKLAEVEDQIAELRLLVQMLEDKYGVRY